LPPPITAPLALNSGPSQWGQYATPRFRYSRSPGTFISRQRAPVRDDHGLRPQRRTAAEPNLDQVAGRQRLGALQIHHVDIVRW